MRFYTLPTVFSFGLHKGKTVEQLLADSPGCFNFCVQVLDHFALRRADVEAWQEQYPKLRAQMTANAWQCLDAKEAEYHAQLARERRRDEAEDDHDHYDSFSARDAERDTFDALTDGQEGDYDDFFDGGGDMDRLRDGLGW